ncbi:MAG: glycosyltransferase [Desulfomonilaceae bacterium]
MSDAEIHQDKKNVLLSTSFVEEARIQELISSCHIGLALYDNSVKNDRYTAFSSEKIALYLRSGVPIITFDNECYQSLFSEFKCGVPLKSIKGLSSAVQEIMSNYAAYQEQCLQAYEKYYNLEVTIPRIINSIWER